MAATRNYFRYSLILLRYSRYVATGSVRNSSSAAWSYAHGPAPRPLLGMTVGEILQQQAEKTPDKEAVVVRHQSLRKTFQNLLQESDSLAAGLLNLGVKKGDRVDIWSANCWEWILAQYGTARAGLILVNINPAFQQQELEYVLRKVGVSALICGEDYKTQKYYDILSGVCPELATSGAGDLRSLKLPDLKVVVVVNDKPHRGAYLFHEVLAASTSETMGKIYDLQHSLQFDEPINIQFTSGTTGLPKGATLTHHNIVNNSYFVGHTMDYHCRDTRICMSVPLYHCFGMVLGSLQCATHGATCVYPAPGFQAEEALQAVQQERCTSIYGTPTMFIDMLNHPRCEMTDFSSVYTGIMAGSPCPVEVMKKCVENMNMKDVTICYGTTETSPVSFQGYMHDPLHKKVTTVGHPASHVEVKVVDEQGAVVPRGVTGELCTRGYTTMLGYWEDPEKTREVIGPDGWYRTGDLAVMDAKGYGQIVGRLKDMVIRGGENIYPLEIEQHLYKHPKIADVQVIGVPHERLGEDLVAWIRLVDGEQATQDEVREFCRGEIAHFKIPSTVRFVTDFPMTVTGKVQKHKMREAETQRTATA